VFTRARLRLTALYVLLMGVTLALVAGGVLVLAVRETRRTDDLELRLRAEGLAADVRGAGAAAFAQPGGAGHDDGHDDREERARIERQGILAYVLPVEGDRIGSVPPSPFPGLPSPDAAAGALAAGTARYDTLTIDQGQLRLYSLPVAVNGRVIAIVQVARSRYFVDTAVTRLLMTVLGLGAAGLALSAVAGFWLAGRTLRPIAAALQRQRDFTADASHELRTPLTLVRGNAELLLRHPNEEIGDYQDVVQDIVDESDRLGRLVGDLLTLARADAGQLPLTTAPVDLSALAAGLARDFEPVAAAKGLSLAADIQPGVTVRGDADRLRQLGVILLDNAVRYTAAGSVAVRVATEGHDAVLTVSDSGPGIAAEHLPHLFERFYRTDAARSSAHGGTGLGLAIAKQITDLHGGAIAATSAVGHGSTFTVRLPRMSRRRPHGMDRSQPDNAVV
jgi:two-component system sensor histidine kinase CiaH